MTHRSGVSSKPKEKQIEVLKTCETLELGGNVGPQYPGECVHVKPLDPGDDNELDEGDHTEQLGLVERDLGVDGVVALLHLDGIIDAIYDHGHNLVI